MDKRRHRRQNGLRPERMKDNARTTPGARWWRSTRAAGLATLLFITALASVAAAHAALGQTVTSAGAAPLIRFAVAHHHGMSWCYGFLSVTASGIRYDVVHPENDRGHSFEASFSTKPEAKRWVLFGTPQDAIELRIGRSTYHFRALADEREVQTGPPRRLSPPEAASPEPLLAAIRDPTTALAAAEPGTPATPPRLNPGAALTQGGGLVAAVPPGPTESPEPGAALAPGMLDGVYVGLQSSHMFGSIDHRFLIFYADGWVMDGMPEDGLDGFNFSAYARDPHHRGQIGRYRADGALVSIVWQDSPANREFVQRDERAADLRGPSVYIPLCRCNGTRFAGAYEWDNGTLQFALDGTFVDRGVIDQLVTAWGFFNHPRVRRGTYAIQNNTLFLAYSDGQRFKTSFAAPAAQLSNQTFTWISVFSFQTLYRQGYQPTP